jgi:hypothetical protein
MYNLLTAIFDIYRLPSEYPGASDDSLQIKIPTETPLRPCSISAAAHTKMHRRALILFGR